MNRMLTIGLVAVAQAALVATAVAPQLSARTVGDTYLFTVEPVDPIDPFRGAYVRLGYPDLRHDDSWAADGGQGALDDGERGDVYITLREEGAFHVADEYLRERPGSGPYLACDDTGWQIRCGIESWFLPQDEALAMERLLRDGAVAAVRIDSRGHAALVDVRAEQ